MTPRDASGQSRGEMLAAARERAYRAARRRDAARVAAFEAACEARRARRADGTIA